MQESIETRPVLKSKADTLGGDVGVQVVAIGFFTHIGIGDEVRHLLRFELIKDVFAAIHALGFKRTFFLREIVEMDALKRNVVEVKVTPKTKAAFHDLREVTADDAATGEGLWQPTQPA